ncbi:hypothetical protein NL676_014686 [Syzygium grande]|nr:hypothetical protein NL676_014686 [Syzygium grande]
MASASLSTPQLPTLQSVPRARGSAHQLGSLSAISGRIRFVPKIAIVEVGRGFAPIPSRSGNQISCSVPEPETLKTVQGIKAKQLSVDESTVAPGTKFVDSGAESLDTPSPTKHIKATPCSDEAKVSLVFALSSGVRQALVPPPSPTKAH